MNTIEEFSNKGYVHLKDFLIKENCKQLSDELKKIVESKKTIKDTQCPLSEAIYGDPVFDKLLEDLLPYVEAKSGLKLYPTYSYARLYTKDEELKNHLDRPSCEISLTITLDWEGEQWAIYMADKGTEKDGILNNGDGTDKYYVKNTSKINMEVGDAVLYRGMDKYHWREKFKGEWQAQVFLHYVNVDGPYTEWKYDKRQQLAHGQSFDLMPEFCVIENALSDSFCDKLIEEYSNDKVEKLLPFIGKNDQVDKTIRNVKRVPVDVNKGIGATLTAATLNSNHKFWKFDITHSNQSEFLMYEPEGKYLAHIDSFFENKQEIRKLTALAFLNDDFEGGKFYISTSHRKTYPTQKKGTIVIFPSYMLHGVEDVIKGNRYTVVTWLIGPFFK